MEFERRQIDMEVNPSQIERVTSSYTIPLDEDYTDKPFIGTTTEMKLERPPRTTLEMLQDAPDAGPAKTKEEPMNLNLNFGGNNPTTTQKTSSGSVPVWIWILGGFVILLLLTIILVSIFKKKK